MSDVDTPFIRWANKAASTLPCPVCNGNNSISCLSCPSSGRILKYPEARRAGLVIEHTYCGNGACWNDPARRNMMGPAIESLCGGSGYVAVNNPLLVMDWLKRSKFANIELVSGGSKTPWMLFYAGVAYGPTDSIADVIYLAAIQTLGAKKIWSYVHPQSWFSRLTAHLQKFI